MEMDYLEGFKMFGLSCFIIISVAIIIIAIIKYKNRRHYIGKNDSKYNHFDIAHLLETIPALSDKEISAMGFNSEDIKNELMILFNKILDYREQKKYNELKKYIGDELYHRYINEDKIKKFTNYKKIDKFYIYEIKKEIDNQYFNCIIFAQPNDDEIKPDSEKYTILKASFFKTNDNKEINCPNCGSILDYSCGDTCPYCRSTINIQSEKMVLIDEQIIDNSVNVKLEDF